VFVDGCYWHGCPEHGPKAFRGPNAALWEEKISANRARDLRNTATLEELGWKVVRIWECMIRRDVLSAARRVEAQARGDQDPPAEEAASTAVEAHHSARGQ
jgi:DNA mismatch endonuclease (patch repair protein)